MPLTDAERNFIQRMQRMETDPNAPGQKEGASLRIIIYLLQQVVSLRERVDELEEAAL